jgi:hypothetical protein
MYIFPMLWHSFALQGPDFDLTWNLQIDTLIIFTACMHIVMFRMTALYVDNVIPMSPRGGVD